jgi:hypothetical protein
MLEGLEFLQSRTGEDAMKKLAMYVVAAASVLTIGACDLESLLDPGYEDEEEEVATGTYTYSFSCPAGSSYSIEIPNRLSSSCRSAWEYYARTYGCNDADNFADAERRKSACP